MRQMSECGALRFVTLLTTNDFKLVFVYLWILCIVLCYRGEVNCKGGVIVGNPKRATSRDDYLRGMGTP